MKKLSFSDKVKGLKVPQLKEKERERLLELWGKVMDDKLPLEPSEVAELNALFEKLTDTLKQKGGDTTGGQMAKVYSELALRTDKERKKELLEADTIKLSLSEKALALKLKVEALSESPTHKALQKKEERKKEESFESFYEAYTQKHGKTL